ncbi:interleukin-17 receptor E-like protein [Mixophyes fleayi]|uniref:interleukin-17 receptor E-like protein n=1 Tax=Mixophyes fleayi TaxID=3061075 RepID=UPI003F4E3A14
MVKCPFVSGQFSAWHMKTLFMEGTTQIIITSPAKAKFSVFICNRTHLNTCDPVQIHALVYVGGSDHVTLNLSREICGPNICVQSLRVDVTYSFPVQICDIPCILEDTLPIEDSSLQMLIVGTVVMVLAIIFTLVGYIILKVWHQKKLQKKTFLKSKVKHFWK